MIKGSNKNSRPADALGKLITTAQTATHAVDDAAALWLGINRTDLRCLGVLIERGPLSASALAEAIGLSKGAMTVALDRLERAGLITREHSNQDRRRVTVGVTATARQAIARLWQPIAQEGYDLLETYGDEERALLSRFFEDYIRLQEKHAARIRNLRRAPPRTAASAEA